jgi:hypothetical protein
MSRFIEDELRPRSVYKSLTWDRGKETAAITPYAMDSGFSRERRRVASGGFAVLCGMACADYCHDRRHAPQPGDPGLQ